MGLNLEQMGKAIKVLEKRMDKRKSIQETMRVDLQMVLDEYISQEIMGGYVKGWFDSVKGKLVDEIAKKLLEIQNDDKCPPIKIKPCPFCGYTNIIVTCESRPRVVCNNCGALAPPGDASNDAMTIWNTRKG